MHRTYDTFGPHREFCGTYISRTPYSYRLCVMMFTEELPWLSGTILNGQWGGVFVNGSDGPNRAEG